MTALPFDVETVPSVGLSVERYAETHGVSIRSVRRWLSAGELPGAVKTGDVWMIPANAQRVRGAGSAVEHVAQPASAAQTAVQQPAGGLSLAGQLDALTAYLTLEDAGRLLGISAYAIRQNRQAFGVVPYGPNGALLVPQAVVRQVAGL